MRTGWVVRELSRDHAFLASPAEQRRLSGMLVRVVRLTQVVWGLGASFALHSNESEAC